MKITVKISDVEVTVDRPAFREATPIASDQTLMNDVVIPTIREASEQAKQLYNLKFSNYNEPTTT